MFRFIKIQGRQLNWEYVLQMHKNHNGTHYDFRIAKPEKSYAYSWATNKFPLTNTTGTILPILARRTHDHTIEYLDFKGLKTKQLKRGKATMLNIDRRTGITIKLDTGEILNLRNIRGKKYLLDILRKNCVTN